MLELASTIEISARPTLRSRLAFCSQATRITQLFAHASDSLVVSEVPYGRHGRVVLRRIMPVSRNSGAYLHR